MKNIFAFLAVAEAKSFTKASKNINLTQPAVTKRIANLEQQFNVKLFERIGHRVVLTDAGHEFLPHALAILHHWQDAEHKIANFTDTVKGTLVIGCNNHIATHRLPALIKTYKDLFPEVDYNFVFRTSNEVIQLISDHQVELGFTSLPREIPEDIHIVKIWKNDMRVILAHNHPFFKQTGNPIDNLSNIPLISPEKYNIYHDILVSICDFYNIKSKTISNINMLETIKKMVEAGIGWSIFPKHLIDDRLREVTLIRKRFYADLSCVYHSKRELSRPAKEMLRCINTLINEPH